MADSTPTTPATAEPIVARIDSKEKLEAWLRTFSDGSRRVLLDSFIGPYRTIEASAADGWWIRRELARTLYDFGMPYGPLPNDVLQILGSYNATPPPYHFLHLSTTDPSKVAFTASWEDGVADRQQQISLGKYVKKTFPHVPEYAIKQVQEQLVKRLISATVLFATDFKQIYEIYRRCAPACMSKAMGGYERVPRTMHPLQAYNAPGFAMAYLQDREESYTARTMVWTNPQNTADKRYVRIYGDALLGSQLVKLGYIRKGLAGAKLARIDFDYAGEGYILCPYIDDHGLGSQGTGNAQSVIIHNDHLEIVKNGTAKSVGCSQYGWQKAPIWVPSLKGNATPVPLDIHSAGALSALTGHTEFGLNSNGTSLSVIVGDPDGIPRWMDFPNVTQLKRFTIPVFPRGRVLIHPNTAISWGLHFRIDRADVGVSCADQQCGPQTLRMNVGGLDEMNGLVQLSPRHYRARYPTPTTPTGERLALPDGVYAPTALTQLIIGGDRALAAHCTKITHGTNNGQFCVSESGDYFVDDAGGTWDWEDTIQLSCGQRVPLIHARQLGTNNIWVDKRNNVVDPKYGVPLNIWRALAVNIDGQVIEPYDDVLLRDRELGISRNIPDYSILIPAAANARHNNYIRGLVFDDQPADTRALLFSEIVTDDDRARTLQLLNLMTSGDLAAALQRSIPDYPQTPLVDDEWNLFHEALRAANYPQPQTTEVLAPQPETATVSPLEWAHSTPVPVPAADTNQELA